MAAKHYEGAARDPDGIDADVQALIHQITTDTDNIKAQAFEAGKKLGFLLSDAQVAEMYEQLSKCKRENQQLRTEIQAALAEVEAIRCRYGIGSAA